MPYSKKSCAFTPLRSYNVLLNESSSIVATDSGGYSFWSAQVLGDPISIVNINSFCGFATKTEVCR